MEKKYLHIIRNTYKIILIKEKEDRFIMNISIKDYYVVIELTIDFDRNNMIADIYFETYDGDYIDGELYMKESICSRQRTLGPWEYGNMSSMTVIINRSKFVKETGLNPLEYINNVMSKYSDMKSGSANIVSYTIKKKASEISNNRRN